MELSLHEWLLDSPLRTTDPHEAHLFYVPIYLASLFAWPVVKCDASHAPLTLPLRL